MMTLLTTPGFQLKEAARLDGEKQMRRKRGEGGLAEKREKQMSKGRKQRSFQNLAGRGGSEGGKISELHRGGVLSGTSIIDF